MKNQNTPPVWDKSHHSIFETFALELKEFTQTKTLPSYGDQDVRYGLELQQRRQQKKNLIMKYDFIPRGLFAGGGGLGRSWSDNHYMSRMEYRTCRWCRSFYRDGKKVFEKKQDSVFYEIITNVHDNDAVVGDLYDCPNCGAVSRIGELQSGCPYCGTFFEMKDLFPKVTNFFFVKDSGNTSEELKHSIGKIVLPCILVSAVGYIIYFYQSGPDSGNLLHALISGILGGIILGSIVGYLLWAMWKLGGLFKEAGKSLPMVVQSAGSGKRFVSRMQQYSPEFSYEYFSDKVVSMLKMIIFSEDAQELPIYEGGPIGNLFSDVIESSYTGAVALKQFQVREESCYVTVDVYLENIYDDGRRIYSRNETVRVFLRRNIKKPVNFHFSIRKIQCKSCGSSFDATKQKTCPNCHTKYEIGDDDWIVTEIKKYR